MGDFNKAINKEFINKTNYFKNSQLTDILLNNLFNVSFDFDANNNKILKKALSNAAIVDYNAANLSIEDELKWNIASVKMPNVSTDYDTKYFHNDRLYINYRDSSDILNISFIENSKLNIRKIIKTWIELTLINQTSILDVNDQPILLYPIEYDIPNLKVYPISGKFESLSYEQYNRVHPISCEDVTLNLNAEVTLPAISVNFVYKKYQMFINT
jgi:hypothetical protein